MNQKSRMFIENIILSVIFLVIFYYLITFILSFFKDVKIALPKVDANLSSLNIDTDILIRNYIKKDINITKVNVQEETKIEKIISDIKTTDTNKSLDINKSSIINTITNLNDLNQTKDTNKTKIQKTTAIQTTKYKISKKNKLKILKEYISNVENTISQNTLILRNVQNNTIRVRITVLKNSSFQNIKFLSGNIKLLYETKKAIIKSFPIPFNDIIKDQFPRYLRLNIKFKSI